MAYATYADILALTGMTTSEITSANVATLMSVADRWVDEETESELSTNQKREAANCLACSFVMANTSGALSEAALASLEGAIRIDNRTATILKQGLSKMFFDRYQYLVSLKPSTDLIKRVP